MNNPSLRRLLPLLLLLLLPVAAWCSEEPGPVMTACVSENVAGVRTALNNGGDPDETYGTSEMTCLHVAALKGNAAMARLLLDNGANKNAPFKLDGGGTTTAEQIARAKNNNDVADLIRDHRRSSGAAGGTPARRTIDGGSPSSSGGGSNPVMTACASEDVAGVRTALDNGGDVDETWGANGMTCLHVAAVKGNRALAQLLLDRGANRALPFKKDDGGTLTAEEIARAKENYELANLIRDYTPPRRGGSSGNSGNAGSDGEAGPVMTACVGENVEGVRSALANGADPDETFGTSAMTCLHVAALKGNRELARVLLEGGANKLAPFKLDSGGTTTPEQIARAKEHNDLADYIRDFTPRRGGGSNNAGNAGNAGNSGDAGERLRKAAENGDLAGVRSALQSGANVNSRDAEGMTPLMYGVAGGSDEVVSALLAAGANVDAQSDKGYTAAAFAVVGNKPAMVKKILARGGDPNLTISGVPLLIFAALKGFTECGQALINAGADVNFKMSNGNSALSVARDKNFPEFVKMLQRNGATR